LAIEALSLRKLFFKAFKVLKLKLISRRPFILLEVMIAFFITAMAILPLIGPHIYIYYEQARFTDRVELDITVGKLYAYLYEQLQKNEISWGDIDRKTIFPITESLLQDAKFKGSFPFRGTYRFSEMKQKKK